MSLQTLLIVVSSLSFYGYSLAYFLTPHMKKEFKRFGLENLGLFIIILEILGATGLLVGLKFKPILLISSLGLAVLMLIGSVVRLRLKDSFWVSMPALFYMVLNAAIFWGSLSE